MRGIHHHEDWGWSNAPRIPVGAAILGGSAIAGGSSLLGSGKATSAASDASKLQMQQFQQTQANLSPFMQAGASVLPQLTAAATAQPSVNYLAQAQAAMPPSMMTEAALEQTPGYQFQLGQGLKATQSAAAARGLGVSGASLKGAAQYATGLADSNYQNQFNNAQQVFGNWLNLNTAAQSNLTNQFNRLSGAASLGESAGANVGAQGTQAAANAGNYLNQSGLAQAAGASGVGSAVTGGINSYLGYNALQQYLGGANAGNTFAAPGTAGGYNQGYDLISPTTGGVTLPPIPP